MTAKVELLTPSGGKVILDPTDTAVDRVLTLPAVAGTVVNNTTLRTELNATGSAPIFACRAFVNFNGTGTVAIRSSGNVSSITDNGLGNYTVNFTTAMPDTNYSTVTGTTLSTTVMGVASPTEYSVGSVRIRTSQAGSGNVLASTFNDHLIINVAIFR